MSAPGESGRDILVCDIGGTNARFALSGARDHKLSRIERLKVADFADLEGAIRHYLASLRLPPPRFISIAVACPVTGDLVAATNSHWRFSRSELARAFDLTFLSVGNDFAALSEAVPYLAGDQLETLKAGSAVERGNKLVIGPGTGLGVGGLAPAEKRGWAVVSGDGGHIALAATDEREDRLVKHLRDRFGRVSCERALCGDGLSNLYRFVALETTGQAIDATPEAIASGALDGSDPVAVKAALMFIDLLGSVAGDLALVMGAVGGIYIGGGIMPRLRPLIEKSAFLKRLVAKGRLSYMVEPMPVYLIAEPHAGLLGARRQFDREMGLT
jgi:glucokinase